MSVRVVIVDDEALARERVRTLLAAERDVEIVAECDNGAAAVAAIREHRPDLVFLDIQMPEMDGFEVLRALGDPLPAVIFVTAYDQYAVKAFEVHAIDYLLKPFKPARLRQALERARNRLQEQGPDDLTQRLRALLAERSAESTFLSRLAVKQGDRVRFIKVEDIDWIEASGNYAIIHAAGEKHMVRETMAALEEKLSPKQFFRVSRSAIVRLDRVNEVQPGLSDEHVVVLRGGVRINMTRGVRELQDRLKFL